MSTDQMPGLTPRQRLRLIQAVILLLAIATWILGAMTVGHAVAPNEAWAVGFALALLVVATAVCLWVLWDPNRGPVLPLGLALIGCGTACALVSVALQFYLASVASDSARRAGELVGQGMRAGQSVNVNVNANVPPSVVAVGYLALLGGLWLAAVGVRVGLGAVPAPAASVPPPLPRPAGTADPLVGPV
jgi:hypothetical protein